MKCTNVSGNLPTKYFGDALREARLAETTAQTTVEQTVCEAVGRLKRILDEAGLLAGINSKKPLHLPRNYEMTWDEKNAFAHVLVGKGCRIASVWKTLGRDYKSQHDHAEYMTALDKFIIDLITGFLEDVAAFAASQGKNRRGSDVPPQDPPCVLRKIYGILMPLRNGWNYWGAKRLDDGTVVVPREHKLLCPPIIENDILWYAWEWPYYWSRRNCPDAGELVTEVRLALAYKDGEAWFAYLNGDTLLPQVIDYADETDDSGEESDPSLVPSGIAWGMNEADALEFRIERTWTAQWTRARINHAVRGTGQ